MLIITRDPDGHEIFDGSKKRGADHCNYRSVKSPRKQLPAHIVLYFQLWQSNQHVESLE